MLMAGIKNITSRVVLFCICCCVYVVFFNGNSWALDVLSYYGHYDIKEKQPGFPSTSLTGPIAEVWASPPKADAPYKIGVLLPHLKDKYWLGVNYGLIEQARKLQVSIKILTAGSYSKGRKQGRQLTDDILNEDVQAIILAPISYDKLDRSIASVTKLGIPVIALINDILAPAISAKIMVSYYDVGYSIGEYVVKESEGRDLRIAFFPGPENSGWAGDTFDGFLQAVKDNPGAYSIGEFTIVAEQYGAMGAKVQRHLVDFVLESKAGVDYIIGNSTAAKEAITVLQQHKKRHPQAKIISSYLTADIYELLKEQAIWASAADLKVEQARMAVDVTVKILNGEKPGAEANQFPFRSGPVIQMIDKSNLKKLPLTSLFGKQGYKPTFQYVSGR